MDNVTENQVKIKYSSESEAGVAFQLKYEIGKNTKVPFCRQLFILEIFAPTSFISHGNCWCC